MERQIRIRNHSIYETKSLYQKWQWSKSFWSMKLLSADTWGAHSFQKLCWWAGNQKSVSLVYWTWNISLLIFSCKGIEIFKSFCINSVSHSYICLTGDSAVNKLPAVQETQEMQVQSLCQEDPLKEGMATHSSILAWRIPWAEEPGGLQSMESQRVRHNWSNWAWAEKIQPYPPEQKRV